MIKLMLIVVLLFGCSKTEYVTKYKEVNIPVRVKINKPNRPNYTSTDNSYTYLLKVLDYIKVLEYTIDTNNNNVKQINKE